MTITRHTGASAEGIDLGAGAWAFGLQHRLELDAASGPAFERNSNAALLERIQTLRTILPAMATEVAIARREGARLRRENATLRGRLAAIENRRPTANDAAATAQESR